MNRRPLYLALVLASTVLACGPKKPPKVDTVDTATTSDPAPPPPPPKCEKLDEKCEAKGGKKARIANISMNFEPVPGWMYAQGEKATVAQASNDGACMALTGHEAPADAKDAKKLESARQTALEVLVGELGITLGKAKVTWKSPSDKIEVGQIKLQVWELKDPVTRGTKKGALLVVASQPGDGKALVAVAFVPEDDEQNGTKIMPSIQTLASGDVK
ncbi:MAG: hypothetical protein IPK82_33030 [Polyangiaceae bacterium]|nr:hypothetical protein [Polyangiaceae bacterium]